jgi:hypothetical protein
MGRLSQGVLPFLLCSEDYMLKERCRVEIINPKYSRGSTYFLGRKGVLERLSGRYCTVLLDGELDELGFFADELTAIE